MQSRNLPAAITPANLAAAAYGRTSSHIPVETISTHRNSIEPHLPINAPQHQATSRSNDFVNHFVHLHSLISSSQNSCAHLKHLLDEATLHLFPFSSTCQEGKLMPNLRTTNRIASICFTALLATCVARAHAQAGNPPPRPVVLPDPTPRDRDLHSIYADDPVQRTHQQQAAALQKIQRRDQVVAETDLLLNLAQQLRDSVVKHDTSVAISDVMTAQKIENLAKDVKEKMKTN